MNNLIKYKAAIIAYRNALEYYRDYLKTIETPNIYKDHKLLGKLWDKIKIDKSEVDDLSRLSYFELIDLLEKDNEIT